MIFTIFKNWCFSIWCFFDNGVGVLVKVFFPPGSKCEALGLGVHFILIYFIMISFLNPKIFFYFRGGGWTVEGGRFPTFMVFNFLENRMVSTRNI